MDCPCDYVAVCFNRARVVAPVIVYNNQVVTRYP